MDVRRDDTVKTVVMTNLEGDFKEARSFVMELLIRNNVGKSMTSETMLIFEALCYKIFEQREREDAVIRISGSELFGETKIKLAFEGGMYYPTQEHGSDLSPEDSILRAYGDKVDYSYQLGQNKIVISVNRSHHRTMVIYGVALLVSLIVYALINSMLSPGGVKTLLDNVIVPLEDLFTNVMLMIGAPVTFLSLLKNLTDVYIISERSSETAKIQRVTVYTSVFAVMLAIPTAMLTCRIARGFSDPLSHYEQMSLDLPLAQFIRSLMPDNMFAPFMTVSPFPLLIIAILSTVAFCSSGKYFDKLKEAIDVCYTLFTKLLSIVMQLLPFFAFVAMLDLMLTSGIGFLLHLSELVLGVLVSMAVLNIFYAMRLMVNGVRIIPFLRELRPIIMENSEIPNSIEAVPFNIRCCTRSFGLNRKKLESSMPVLAEVNLDGNCFIITLISVSFLILSGSQYKVTDIAILGALVFFLSLGAPNQPGSCLIGMLILLNYLNATDLMPMAILCEVLFGGLLNLTNVTGDIVTVVCEEKNLLREDLKNKNHKKLFS